jgi:ABC-type Fe3+ transport system substrate-binding protein
MLIRSRWSFMSLGCFLLIAVSIALSSPARHSLAAAAVEEVALMKSADRQKVLIEGARKEGKLTWYTTLIVNQVVRPVKEAFEKEYPFVQIEFHRANSEPLTQKALAEHQSKKYAVDVIDGSTPPTTLRRAGLMERFYSPYSAEYPAELKDSQGFWGVTNLYFLTLGYNTRMIKPNEVPKAYDDLLNPRWKGQMIWPISRGSGAPMFVGNILLSMGQEAGKAYLQKLKGQNIAKSTASNRQVLDMVIAGEYPIALQTFNHHAYISKKAGAPVEWQPLEPLNATIHTVGLPKNAPHPYTAMLFLDFVLSKRGQRVYQSSDYLPAHPEILASQPDLKPGGGRFKRATYINPDVHYDKINEWGDFFETQFVK